MDKDLDHETYAIIRANTAAGIRLNNFSPPDPSKEDIMTMANVIAQRAKIKELLDRMATRRPVVEPVIELTP